MKTKLNRILLIFVLFLSVTFILNSTGNQTEPTEPQDLSPQSIEIKQGSPKMEHVLYRLMKTYYGQGIEKAKEFADRRGITIKNNNVRVVTEAKIKNDFQEETTTKDTGAVSDIKGANYLISEQIKALGGKVETSYSNMIQSVIPIDGLEEISNLSNVKYLRLPKKPVPLVISEGVSTTDADQWQEIPPYRTNEEVKVCILDLGFKGYQNLLGSELPDSVVTRSFRSDWNLKYDKHGTACAEIVHDMAPNAELYLVNFSTDVEQHNAIDWIINQGVDIISYSVGWTNWGAGDGTGWICEDVEKADDNGIIWVSAAGNSAEDHWEGNYKDYDNDKWHNFSGSDELLIFYVNAYTSVWAALNWNDWGYWDGNSYDGSDQDFDLYLYYWNGYYWQYVDGSENWQTGYQCPIEFVGGYLSISTWWGVAIRKYSASKNVKHELFINGASGSIQYNEKSGSLIIPADSSSAIAVGATDWSDDFLHYYSSRGPTSDNRIKPDLSAPSGVSGVTYGTVSFYGTSASTPHVAGAFALLKEKFPYTLNQIKSILEARAKDLGPSGKDNLFGIGRLKLSK